jgi:hypothetical protein
MKFLKQTKNTVVVLCRYCLKNTTLNIKHVIRVVVLKYNKIQSFIEKDNSANCIYKDLTPKASLETNKPYIESLDWALSSDNILNIAITGPYGSGKSSVLKTYEENRSFYRYLTLSLATFHTFTDCENADKGNIKTTADKKSDIENLSENEIEKRILQQLFYKVNSKKIPFGRFRKINNIKSIDVIKGFIFVLVIAALASLLFAPEFCIKLWNDISNNYLILQELYIPKSIVILGYILLVILLSKLIISVIKSTFRSLKLSKLSVNNAEVEIKPDNENSIFNRYLDEILYFFEVNPYQIVFIEDLDRFNDVKIFMKLRELNALINNSEQINRKVVFIYAIKDDMFINKDRTKFFDYILPIIPIINSSNSGELLWRELIKHNLSEGLSEHFISDICIYIDDMRILNNIFNEYIIYKNKLMSTEESFLNPIRMFAMIAYKNIYPNDFARLQYDKGDLYDVFVHKHKLLDKYIVQLKGENEILEEQLNNAGKECLQSEKEIRTIYWNEAVAYRSDIYDICINGNYYTLSQVLQDGFDISIIKNDFSYRYYNGPNGGLATIRASMDLRTCKLLLARIDTIKRKSDDVQEEIHERMEQIKELISHMKSWTLKKAIEKIGDVKFFPDRNHDDRLMIFLLRNGYIEEMYPNYINYFYAGSLTYYDMIFIMKIKDHIVLELTHPLKNFEKIMTKLNIYEFERKEILNYDLMNYLVDNNAKYKEQFDFAMKQLSDEDAFSISFIDSFLSFVNCKPKFISELCCRWHNIWKCINNNLSFSENRKEEFLQLILLYADIDDIREINEDNCIGTYVSAMPMFLEFLPDENTDIATTIVKELDIHFSCLNVTNESNLDLLNFIIDNDFYELNYNMVKLFTLYKSDVDEESLSLSHLTIIKALNYKPIWTYIHKKLPEYIENVFLNIEKNVHESEKIVMYLLNEDSLSPETKEAIITKELVLISDITSIPEPLWEYIIAKLKLKCSWNNMLNIYIRTKTIVKEIATFLNLPDNYTFLSKTKMTIDTDFEEEVYNSLSKDLICCTDINSDTFGEIYKSLSCHYSDFQCEELSMERLKKVIEYGLFNFTKEIHDNIRVNHKAALVFFVSKNINNFLSNISNFEVDSEDIFSFISFEDISSSKKLELIIQFDEVISCNSAAYAVTLCNVIFENKQPIEISDQMLRAILSQNISQDNKIQLLLNQKKYLSLDFMKDYLDSVGAPYDQMMRLKKRPTVSSTKLNRELLEMLKEHNLINSFDKEKDGRIRAVAKYQ